MGRKRAFHSEQGTDNGSKPPRFGSAQFIWFHIRAVTSLPSLIGVFWGDEKPPSYIKDYNKPWNKDLSCVRFFFRSSFHIGSGERKKYGLKALWRETNDSQGLNAAIFLGVCVAGGRGRLTSHQIRFWNMPTVVIFIPNSSVMAVGLSNEGRVWVRVRGATVLPVEQLHLLLLFCCGFWDAHPYCLKRSRLKGY